MKVVKLIVVYDNLVITEDVEATFEEVKKDMVSRYDGIENINIEVHDWPLPPSPVISDNVDGAAPIYLALRPKAAEVTRTTILTAVREANDALNLVAATGFGPARAHALAVVRANLTMINDYAAGNLPG